MIFNFDSNIFNRPVNIDNTISNAPPQKVNNGGSRRGAPMGNPNAPRGNLNAPRGRGDPNGRSRREGQRGRGGSRRGAPMGNPNAPRGRGDPNGRSRREGQRGRGAPRGNPNAPRGGPMKLGPATSARGVSKIDQVRMGGGVSRRGPRPSAAAPPPTNVEPTPTPNEKNQEESSTKKIVFNSTLSFTANSQNSPSAKKEENSVNIPKVASVSSLTEDIATKEMFKYDPEAEASAIDWIEQVTGLKKVGTMHEWLKSGVVLCTVLNKIKPGCVVAKESKISFVHRENIGNYLDTCQKIFNITSASLFQTIDLYEEKNMNLVTTSIHFLAKEVAKNPNYNVPKIREVVASVNNALYNVSFVNGLPPVHESDPTENEISMIKWVNSHLSNINLSIERISSGLRNGVKLIHLMEYFTGIPRLGTYVKEPQNLWHAMQNISLLLKFLHQQTGEKPPCRGQQITMGVLDSILTLLEFIRSKFDRDYVFKKQNCE